MRNKSLIEVNPQACFGKPVFAGTRIPVFMAVELIAAGKSAEEILKDYYPSLTKEHLKAALSYAARLLARRSPRLAEAFGEAQVGEGG